MEHQTYLFLKLTLSYLVLLTALHVLFKKDHAFCPQVIKRHNQSQRGSREFSLTQSVIRH